MNKFEVSPQSYEQFFSLALDLFCIAGTDGRFRHLNPAWEELLGHSKEELCSRPFVDYVHPDDRDATVVESAKLAQGEDSVHFENRYLCRDGHYKWILWKAKKVGDLIYAVARDISALKRTEFALRLTQSQLKQVVSLEKEARAHAEEQSHRLRELFAKVPAIAAVLHGPEHRYTFANSAYRKLIGDRDPTGKTVREVLRSLDPAILRILDDAYQKGERYVASERPISADWEGAGEVTERFFNFIYEPTRNISGAVEGIWVLAFDVTEEKALKRRLELTERMASLGTLAAGVGHEINNPLSYVGGSLELASRELSKAILINPSSIETDFRAKALQLISDARQGVDKIAEIVRSLKIFSRQEADEPRSVVDVHVSVESAVKFARSHFQHRARISISAEKGCKVLAHPVRLSQVFLNLLVNAAQAIEPGREDENEILVTINHSAGGRVRIAVKDTGCGMSAETMNRLFDPFFTTKPVGVGTGLGLPISHAIVTSFGGGIRVTSEIDRGSTFEIFLPVHDGVQPEVAPKVKVSQVRALKVLVVDDEFQLAKMVKELLEEDGNEVRVVQNGVEALEVIRGDSAFDIILCDLMMPKMTGMDFFTALRGLSLGVEEKIIFMTGGAFTPEAVDVITRYPNRSLEKPFTRHQLFSVIASVALSATT